MLKISYAGCLGVSPAISAQFTLEMCVAFRNREKFTRTPYFGGLRSFQVIDVDISKKLVASACYDKQHVCACIVHTQKKSLIRLHFVINISQKNICFQLTFESIEI